MKHSNHPETKELATATLYENAETRTNGQTLSSSSQLLKDALHSRGAESAALLVVYSVLYRTGCMFIIVTSLAPRKPYGHQGKQEEIPTLAGFLLILLLLHLGHSAPPLVISLWKPHHRHIQKCHLLLL